MKMEDLARDEAQLWRDRLLSLLRQHSVKFGTFTLRSGKQSDFYVDCRPVILSREGHIAIGSVLAEVLYKFNCTHVAALGMGATHIASAICSRFPMSAIHVRDAQKDHGTKRLVELPYNYNDSSVVGIVDDVLTTGSSVQKCYAALMEQGIVPVVCAVLVDRQEAGSECIENDLKMPVKAVFRRLDFMP